MAPCRLCRPFDRLAPNGFGDDTIANHAMRNFKGVEKYSPEERLRREIPLLGASDEELRALYPVSLREAEQWKAAWETLQIYCAFVGYPRSGHSIIGSLLDAHAQAIIAHELDALRVLENGFGEQQLYYLLIENSRRFTQYGRQWGSYSFLVPGQWQGKFTQLKVIGDNKAGMTTTRIGRNPALLEKLAGTVRLELKFIHVIRNPFDNIATIALKQTNDLGRAINQYFSMCHTNGLLQQRFGRDQLFDVHHEDFISDPRSGLMRLCEFLGLPPSEEYLAACVDIVYRLPHKSRYEVDWPRGALDFVNTEKEKYGFLRRYSSDD